MSDDSNPPTITEFLLARIAEDEENAGRYVEVFPDGDMAPLFRRVLAECAAKRAIIGPVTEDEVTQWEIWSRSRKRTIPADQIGHWGHETGPTLDILRTLAAVYGDHPDYQQEWAL